MTEIFNQSMKGIQNNMSEEARKREEEYEEKYRKKFGKNPPMIYSWTLVIVLGFVGTVLGFIVGLFFAGIGCLPGAGIGAIIGGTLGNMLGRPDVD